jgi:hypothetical protein
MVALKMKNGGGFLLQKLNLYEIFEKKYQSSSIFNTLLRKEILPLVLHKVSFL